MRYHPFTGFTQDPEPTSIEYGICQGCKDHMPVNAKCTRVTNAGFLRPLEFCESVGPKMECFVPQHLRKEIDLLQKHKPQLQNHCRQIAEFAFPVADQRIVVSCYGSYLHIQLDASAYDQPRKIVLKNLSMLIEEHYIHNNPTFFYDAYEAIHDAARCSKDETLTAVTRWEDAKTAKHPDYFTMLQLAYLDRAKESFLANVDTDEEESEDEE